MKPRRRNQRLGLIAIGALIIAGAAALVFSALEKNIAYFYTPSEALTEVLTPETRIRLGGLVESGSVKQAAGAVTTFKVTDGAQSISVRYAGIVPDLFREGQGVIAQGRLSNKGVFIADTILAKHDENYIPRELVDVIDHAESSD